MASKTKKPKISKERRESWGKANYNGCQVVKPAPSEKEKEEKK